MAIERKKHCSLVRMSENSLLGLRKERLGQVDGHAISHEVLTIKEGKQARAGDVELGDRTTLKETLAF